MKYNPDVHHRKSIRLKDYDYSQEGMYFVTICTKDRENHFGEIMNVGAGLASARATARIAPTYAPDEIERYRNNCR